MWSSTNYLRSMLKKYEKQPPNIWERRLVVVFGALFAITVLLFAVWAVVLFVGPTSVDACLDQGGSYDYELQRCDFESDHPVP